MSDRDPHDPRHESPTNDASPSHDRREATTGGTAVNDYSLDRLTPDLREQGAESGEARLAGVPGIGTMQVMRDREGNVLHVEGTWRASDETTDTGPIESALSAGGPLRYEGRLADPAHPDRERCDVEVEVTSRSTYTWDAREEDDGRTLPLFNLRPREGQGLDR